MAQSLLSFPEQQEKMLAIIGDEKTEKEIKASPRERETERVIERERECVCVCVCVFVCV